MKIDLNEFDVFWKDELQAHVKINPETSEVDVTSYSDNVVENPFAVLPCDIHYVNDFISDRCFEKNNASRDFFLQDLGLSTYNPWEIVPITHGFMWEDATWVRFKGQEHLQWKDVDRHDRD